MTHFSRQARRRPAALIAIAGLLLLTAGCGARLSQSQVEALDKSSSGAVTPGAGNTGTTSGGGSTGTLPNGSTATTTNASTGGNTATTTKGGGSTNSNTASHGGTGGTGGGSTGGGGGGGGTIGASSPLAGPGGKICPNGAPGSGPGVTSSTITVGNIVTINGPVPNLFTGARYGTQAFADYVNANGGLCGRQLKVSSADDQFDQATDQNEAAAMSSQVLAFLGSFTLQDGGITAGAPGVPDIGNSISADRFNSPTNFSPQPNPPGFQTSAYLYFKSNPQYAAATQHMAALVENTPQTATTGAWVIAALKSVGYKFIFTDTNLQPTDPTFNGDVQKMKADGVTGVIFQATGTIIGQLANAMYGAGMKVVLGNYAASGYDPAYIQNAGPGTAGTALSQSLALYAGQDAASIPMVATFDQWYNRVNPGQTPDIYAAYGWLSGMLFSEGINAGGAPTRAALLAGLKQITSFNGAGMVAPGNPAGKVPSTCFVIIDVKNNQFVRDPATPSGFSCSPSGYYHFP